MAKTKTLRGGRAKVIKPRRGAGNGGGGNLAEGSTWRLVASMIFGAVVFLSFVGFAIYGNYNPGLLCNSYVLIAAVFAFGAALSGAFIGGTAAARGTFGNSATNQTLTYTLGGGTAFLLITFAAFKIYEPAKETCRPISPKVELELRDVPSPLKFRGHSQLWTRLIENDSVLVVLVEDRSGFAEIRLATDDGDECTIALKVATDDKQLNSDRHKYTLQPTEYTSSPVQITLRKDWLKSFMENYKGKKSPGFIAKLLDEACFRMLDGNEPINGYLAILPNEKKLFRSAGPATATTKPKSVDNFFKLNSPKFTSIVSTARAQSLTPPESFTSLKSLLTDKDSEVRSKARQYLAANFESYKSNVFQDLFTSHQPDYLAELLQSLTTAIDTAEGGKFLPDRPRNLNNVPYLKELKGKEAELVKLTGDSSDAVRKQARRLISRYPIPAFDEIYTRTLSNKIKESGCTNFEGSNDQATLYGAIFYYYNRVVQYGFEKTFGETQIQQTDNLVQKGVDLSQCLNPNLKADAASLLFAKAVTYSQFTQTAAQSKILASEFLNTVDPKKYYSPSHIEIVSGMIK